MPCMPEIISKGLFLEKLDDVLNDPNRRRALRNNLESLAPNGEPAIDLEKCGAGIPALLFGDVLTVKEQLHLRDHWFSATGWWPDAVTKSDNGRDGVEKTIRKALVRLIELADEDCCKRVSCYWVCGHMHDHSKCHLQGSDEPGNDHDHDRPHVDPRAIISDIPSSVTGFEIERPWTPPHEHPKVPPHMHPQPTPECDESDRVTCTITKSPVQLTFTIHTPAPLWVPAPGLLSIDEPIEVTRWDVDKQDIVTVSARRMSWETAILHGIS